MTNLQIKVQIGTKTLTALVDTICTTSAVSKASVADLGNNILLQPEISKFRNADGTLGQTTHRVAAMLKLLDFSGKRTCAQEIRLADTLLYPAMLERDFLRKQRIILNFETCEIAWDGIDIPRQMRPRQKKQTTRRETNTENPLPAPVEEMLDGPMLTNEKKIEILDLLHEFEPLFSGKLGTFRNKEPYVLSLLADSQPVTCRPFPIPRVYYDATRMEVQQLIDMGILERDSSSEWTSPAYVIPKKDGTVRLVCDFQRLNKLLCRKFYPTRDVKETRHSLDEPEYMSVFDIPQSYYARLLARASPKPTAIVLPWGTFVFNRLLMRVSTAPDEFQSCMDEILGDYTSFKEHIQHLRLVFNRLQEARLTLHPKKSMVCAEFVEFSATKSPALVYLRFQTRWQSPEPHPSHLFTTQPARCLPIRRDGKLLSRNAATACGITEPVDTVDVTGTAFSRGTTEQEAFEAIKAAMMKMVLLPYPKSGHPFHVYTDTSKDQLGAVIMQDGIPIAFWSKKCNGAQASYPANRLELLSILLLLREFRSTLLGQELHVHTGHLNLTYSTSHDVHMKRWLLEIEEYGPVLHYALGASNVVAYALSRLPTTSDVGSTLEEREPIEHCSMKIEFAAVEDDTTDTGLSEFSLNMDILTKAQCNDNDVKKN
ncbi:Pol protein [Phytophthora palmivora]|uniref:Pol protein n=1 Tax=Phytophthora palmivora TaxID=4796 RepID=A0A2P4Y681_9STRA|nr:Pol protein [Phytophthora palmivora]